MKKSTLTVFVLAAMLVLIVGAAFAQSDLPGSGWWSGEQVQNVGAAQASVMITAYESAPGTGVFMEETDLPAGASYTFTPFNAFNTMPDGFKGSAVVSADQPIKAVVNVTNQLNQDLGVAGGRANAQYQGTSGDAVATTLYFPLAKGDHFGKTSSFYIQNAGATDATGVVATFRMRNGDTHNYNVPTIAPNKMVVFSVFDSPTYTGTGVNDSRVGGLVVVGSQTMAGVVMEHDHNVAPAVVLNGTRGLTSADFATTAYAPIIKSNRFGRFTGLQVQNVSAGPIDVTVSYEGTAGACAGSDYTETADDLAPNASVTFVHFPGRTSLPENCTASATVTATGNFVSIVNEQEMTGMPKAGITYFGLTNATNTISVPQYKDVRFNATSGLQIQNVGNAAATSWTATFVCQGGASFTAISDPAKTGAIPAGGAFNFFTPSDNDLFTAANPFASNNVNCAVTIEADQPIVAVNNEMAYPAVGVLDDNNFEGFNLP